MPNISEFKKCSECSPAEKGVYLVIKFWNNKLSYATEVDFVPGYGWNVDVEVNGTVNTDTRIMFEEDERAMWAEVTLSPDEIREERWETE